VQDQGRLNYSNQRTADSGQTLRPYMRLSRIFRSEDLTSDDGVPLRRTLFWIIVWIVVLLGVVLYFKYSRLLTPLLD
jgi:hypothetical protein